MYLYFNLNILGKHNLYIYKLGSKGVQRIQHIHTPLNTAQHIRKYMLRVGDYFI